MPPQVWKKPELRRVRLEQGLELEQLVLVLVLGKQQLELGLGPQLQELQRELLLLGLLLQHLLGVMLLLQLLLTLEMMTMTMQQQWQGLMMEMKLGMASQICSVQYFLSCMLRYDNILRNPFAFRIMLLLGLNRTWGNVAESIIHVIEMSVRRGSNETYFPR